LGGFFFVRDLLLESRGKWLAAIHAPGQGEKAMSADDLNNRTSPIPEDDDTPIPPADEAGESLDTPHDVPHDDADTLILDRDEESVETDVVSPDDVEPEAAPGPPSSAAPPRVVAETPLGGVVKVGRDSEPEPGAAAADQTDIDADTPREAGVSPDLADQFESISMDDVSDSVSVPPKSEPPVETLDSSRETVPGDAEAAALAERMQRAMAGEAESAGQHDDSGETDAGDVSRVTVDTSSETPDNAVPDASDWGDDLSPELASVLFAPKSDAPAETPARIEDISGERAPAAAEVAPAEASPAAPPAGPVLLTSKDGAHSLPISAEGHAAPPPDAPLTAKARYMRVEEPLKNDKGQRIEETWSYFKGDYPALDGRLVRKASSVTMAYADGSWKWRYERRYDDRGRDRREVRANADETYFERADTVSVIDAEGKRSHHDEDAALIYAASAGDDKRGGLLGSLFGRDKDDDGSGAKTWRDATAAEMKQARKEGGQAFERSLFERLF
jgi:hypothetical protein